MIVRPPYDEWPKVSEGPYQRWFLIRACTCTGWSFIGNNFSKPISIEVLFKQMHTNKAQLISKHRCVRQRHTNKAPTNKCKHPSECCRNPISACNTNLRRGGSLASPTGMICRHARIKHCNHNDWYTHMFIWQSIGNETRYVRMMTMMMMIVSGQLLKFDLGKWGPAPGSSEVLQGVWRLT